jgi:ribonuclease HI
MKFILCNFKIAGQPIVENYLDQTVFKELGFNSKVVSKLPDGSKSINYNFVLIPLVQLEIAAELNEQSENFASVKFAVATKIKFDKLLDNEYLDSIAVAFREPSFDIDKIDMEITILGETDDSKFNIFYTDGSFKKATEESSYAVCKLTNEDDNGKKDLFTEKNYLFETFVEKMQDSTNNIGELTGIKTALLNKGNKLYQVIVSDSEYGIKCFREWYYNWKNNGFKTYAKKDIQNKELIQEIFDLTKNSDKIVLFKWVKGHNKDYFNELCDELAKEALK